MNFSDQELGVTINQRPAIAATLLLTVLSSLPRAALLICAAAGAFDFRNEHRLFAFAPPRCLGASASERP
jgi:hypothetical protein